LFPHPFDSTSRTIAFINSLIWILGCFIALLVNVSRGSIIVVNSILYPTSRSFILGVHDMVYYIIFGVWIFLALFSNGISSSTTFSFSFYWIATLSNYFCRLWVTMQFMFVAILPFFFWNLKKITNWNPYNFSKNPLQVLTITWIQNSSWVLINSPILSCYSFVHLGKHWYSTFV
jgi:hypothetical protein